MTSNIAINSAHDKVETHRREGIRDHCGMEGIRKFDEALKAGCAPRQIALAIQAEMERRAMA